MRKRAPLLAAISVVALACWTAVAAAEPPTTSISTDTVVPGTTQSSTFTDANGDTVTKTEVDFTWASIVNAFVGSGHAVIFRITHASTGISDTTQLKRLRELRVSAIVHKVRFRYDDLVDEIRRHIPECPPAPAPL